MIRGIRGATTVIADQEELVLSATEALLTEIITKNQIDPNDVASIFISATHDLSSTFPAKALRRFEDWTYVPVMCMQEVPVKGGLPLCIRVMMHVNSAGSQQDIQHIYQENAIQLRPDLADSHSSTSG